MNPIQFVADIKKDLEHNLESCNNTDKVFTEKDVSDKMLKLVNTLGILLDNSDFELSVVNVASKELTVEGLLLKASELENIIIVQPLAYMTAVEHDSLMHYVQKLSNKGEFNGKSMLILPYDMLLLKTKLANNKL